MNMKQLMKNRIFPLIAVLMTGNIGCAQTHDNTKTVNEKYGEDDLSALARYLETSYCPHELSFWTAGGVSSLNKSNSGKSKSGFGGSFGVGYTYFLNRNWGLATGLEYAFYQSKIGIDNFSDSYGITDMFGNPVAYQTRINGYSETHKLGMFNIPLSVLYQTNGKHKFYASLGGKVGLPVSAKYNGSNAILNIAGYYPDYDQTEIWQNGLGYGVFNTTENSGKLDLDVSLLGTIETGVKWNVGVGTALYTGIFADYGFNSMLNICHSDKRFVEYNSKEPSKPVVNTACVLSDKFSPMNFGVKLKLAFSVGCRDLLNDRKAYKSMQKAQYDDFHDFTPEMQLIETQSQSVDTETAPPVPVVPLDSVQTKFPETEKQPEADTAAIHAEREVYLEAAKARRQKYSQSMNVSSTGNMGNYNLGIVTLTAEQETVLDEYIEVLTENPLCILHIIGHTCDLGSEELNLRIGQERANLAKDYLVEKGIAASRIATFSKGKSEPLFLNTSEENRKKNRRLEIITMK
jgi:outer membrane protein OmpA-like peptidoglycan-associated protein